LTATVGPLGLYRPGASPLHRMPAGIKLGVLALAGAGSVWVDTPGQTGTALAVVLALHPLGRIPIRVVTDMLRPLLWTLVPLSVFQLLVAGWARTTVLVGVILALVLLELAAEVRDAQRARGLESSPRALVVPLLVRTLRRADEIGEALVARGAAD
jgi:biotin transport system permease protein